MSNGSSYTGDHQKHCDSRGQLDDSGRDLDEEKLLLGAEA